MTCPNCGGTTTAGQKFCFECGTPTQACANCGAPLPPGAKFCGECGASVAEATAHAPSAEPDAAPKPERRLVSVLFGDLVGFTSASESSDPEEVRDFLTRYSELASDTIHRYGGTVDKFLGDGVMAIWGTPRAFEDDPERAVRAALDLITDVAALGNEFRIPEMGMRVGITTGEAAVTVDHGDHGMVAGDLVNTASRLEATAEPGTVLVNEATYLATNEAISYQDKGELTLKGKTRKVSVWRPINVMSMRGGAGKTRGLEAPFVGRVAEFQLLRDLFKATTRDGRAHLVSVQGIPGIGKSRLVWEFEKHLDGLADTFFWHQGRSPAYGEGVTFWALGEMVRRRAGIAENDNESVTLSRLGDTVEEFVPEEDRSWVAIALEALLGVGESSMERDELFAAWRSFFHHLAGRQATIMVFEDLQWADHGTIDFVESLLEWSRDYPIFVVTLARPELLDRRPNWGAGQRGFTGLHLEPLPSEEMSRLLEGLAPGLPEGLTSAILKRAEGVPLYAVETVRMLLGQGHLVNNGDGYRLKGELPRLTVPETLHALVAARLDTLDPEHRRLLQMASVLGQTFTAKALADLADLVPGEVETRLEPLIRREILSIETDPRSPERGQYRFVQGVIKEVAYAGLPRTEKSDLHIRVAEFLAELGDEELAGVIASHYLDAYNAIEERDRDQTLRRRALDALVSAAERAYGLGSYLQAVSHFEQAMRVSDEESRSVALSLRAGAAAVMAALSEVAERHYSSALDSALSMADQRLELEAVNGLAGVLLMESRVDEALRLFDKYESRVFDDITPEVAALHAQMARAQAFASRGDKAADFIERALAEGAELGLTELIADAMVTKGWVLALEGRFLEGEAVTEGALHFAHRHGLPRPEFRAMNNIAAYIGWDEPSWALELLLPGYEEAARAGSVDDRTVLGAKLMWLAVDTGDWDLSDRLIDELAETNHSWFADYQIQTTTARLAAYRGDADGAKQILDNLEPRLLESSSNQDVVTLLDVRGQILLASGDPGAAADRFQDAFDLGFSLWDHALVVNGITAAIWLRDEQGLGLLLERGAALTRPTARFRSWMTIGHAARQAMGGDSLKASRMFDDAAETLRDLRIPLDLALCHIDRVAALGSTDEGVSAAVEEARRIYTELGATPFLARLDELVGG